MSQELSSLTIGGSTSSDIGISGNLVFSSNNYHGIDVWDITDIANPQQLMEVQIGEFNYPRIFVEGNDVFLAGDIGGIFWYHFSIGNPITTTNSTQNQPSPNTTTTTTTKTETQTVVDSQSNQSASDSVGQTTNPTLNAPLLFYPVVMLILLNKIAKRKKHLS